MTLKPETLFIDIIVGMGFVVLQSSDSNRIA